MKRLVVCVVIAAALTALIWGAYYEQEEGGIQAQANTVQEGDNGYYGKDEEPSRRVDTARTGTGRLQGRVPGGTEGTGTLADPSPGSEGTSKDRVFYGLASRGNTDAGRYNWNSADTYKVTAYTAGFESCGKLPDDPEYGVTATGTKVQEGITIAADWNVLPPGTVVYIENVGRRIVEDKGGAVRGKHIDLYLPDLEDAQAWGVKYLKVIIIEMGEKV
jgi:3D (Asp-Asp-Asp) domain-containing protein